MGYSLWSSPWWRAMHAWAVFDIGDLLFEVKSPALVMSCGRTLWFRSSRATSWLGAPAL
ncbi:hypothetical protein SAMN05444321_5814 [Bradyrhizobium lablabi]|nr:hypothetical protein SAMN05444321_5814 [Bradyrhizobium lablabi]